MGWTQINKFEEMFHCKTGDPPVDRPSYIILHTSNTLVFSAMAQLNLHLEK